MTRARLLAFAWGLTACAPSLDEALARGDWVDARAIVHERSGVEKRRLDEWIRRQSHLEVAVHAEEIPLATGQQGPSTLPIRLHTEGRLSVAPLRAKGHYDVSLRAGGIRWTSGMGDLESSFRTAGIVELLLGSGGPFAAYDKQAATEAFANIARLQKHDDAHPEVLDMESFLMPTHPGFGEDAIVIHALVEWPDAATDPDAALRQKSVEFILPLPPGARLVDRINAVSGRVSLSPSPHDTHQDLGDL